MDSSSPDKGDEGRVGCGGIAREGIIKTGGHETMKCKHLII